MVKCHGQKAELARLEAQNFANKPAWLDCIFLQSNTKAEKPSLGKPWGGFFMYMLN